MDLKNYKHVHCIGIGGIGLSAVAEIFLSRGYIVTGSDMKESTVTDQLISCGAKIFFEHAASNIDGADLLVYSNAVSMENPELVAAKANGIPCITRAEALGALMSDYKTSIAISGTHGKTTTTSMISLILEEAQLSPTILVGGILDKYKSNYKVGDSDYFVTEACEYMDSFLSLNPWMEVILNIDSDHLDYFKDIDHIAKSFSEFASRVPKDGFVIAYDSNPFVNSVTENLDCNVIKFGFNETSDFYAKNIKFNELGCPSFDLYERGILKTNIQLSVPGEHNVSNSLAATAACVVLGVDIEIVKKTLETFTGTQRRFDIVGKTKNGLTIIDDYAHHPTEIKATLAAAQNVPHKSIWCLFQPHTYTRTIALFDQFADAFNDADKLVLAEIYAAREKNIYKISAKKLQEEIKKKHPEKEVYFMPDFNSISDFVTNNADEGDIVITMGAGDIYKIGDLILEKDK
ncbi:MAG: UDP-N-acetylmuramate--L-alanine ligase [Bacillota bacterium]|nr:UDP-N-acetylmuramate--L-alanine ligase [Bacillota bacterium]